jgi:hypothetical protein
MQRGLTVTYLGERAYRAAKNDETTLEALVRALGSVSLDTLAHVYLVDERDERNLELLIALISINRTLPIVAALFNENIAPHLRAAHRTSSSSTRRRSPPPPSSRRSTSPRNAPSATSRQRHSPSRISHRRIT